MPLNIADINDATKANLNALRRMADLHDDKDRNGRLRAWHCRVCHYFTEQPVNGSRCMQCGQATDDTLCVTCAASNLCCRRCMADVGDRQRKLINPESLAKLEAHKKWWAELSDSERVQWEAKHRALVDRAKHLLSAVVVKRD